MHGAFFNLTYYAIAHKSLIFNDESVSSLNCMQTSTNVKSSAREAELDSQRYTHV